MLEFFEFINYNIMPLYLKPYLMPLYLNPGPIQIYPAVSTNIWKPLNKEGLHFLHINKTSLLPKINELKCISNKTKAVALGIAE